MFIAILIAVTIVYCLIGFGLYKGCGYLANNIPFFDVFGPEPTPESVILWMAIWPIRATLYFAGLVLAWIAALIILCIAFARAAATKPKLVKPES